MMTATVEEKLAIAEMARQLRAKAATEKANRRHYSATLLTRTADLLERQALSAAADGPAVPEGREPAAVAAEPSNEELDELAWNWYSKTGSTWYQVEAFRAFARAALARWGRPAAPPAPPEGEAGEQPGSPEGEARALARAIDEVAKGWHPQACLLGNVTAKQFRLAAALLRQYWLLLGRQHRLQEENHRFREPERTILCDILANGTLLPDPDGTRYWDPSNAPAVVAVSERLPEPSVKVLAYYFNDLGKGRAICAIWVPAKTRSDSYGDDDFTEYDEGSDTFYWPEGWYETIENWDDLGYVKVDEGEVIYWQPLPKWPAHALPCIESD